MKSKTCQAKSEAKTWDDLIEFTEAKIDELKTALETWKRSKAQGLPMPGGRLDGHKAVEQHSV
jgi:hypothetical protein